jgi:hypothetical protein
MLYLLDNCVHDEVRKRLKTLGYDCRRWRGDPTASDKVIAVEAEHQGRVLISADRDFVDLHRGTKVALGWHVHVIGRKPDQPRLLEARIAELDSKIKACGPGLFILEEGEDIIFEKPGARAKRLRRGSGRRRPGA